jgi:hypothetical protein
MNPKGHSPVDLETAERASSRRSFIGAVSVAGLASAAALAVARPASAALFPTTDEDRAVLDQAMRLELTARDLYIEALDAGVSDDISQVVETLSANHAAYAQAIAASTGTPAEGRNEALFAELSPAFATSDSDTFAMAGWNLENSMVATHTELLSGYESFDAVSLTGSILVVEARQATVLADIGGFSDDLDLLFDPQAEPFSLGSGEPEGSVADGGDDS